jgi:hypothetical protein
VVEGILEHPHTVVEVEAALGRRGILVKILEHRQVVQVRQPQLQVYKLITLAEAVVVQIQPLELVESAEAETLALLVQEQELRVLQIQAVAAAVVLGVEPMVEMARQAARA